MSIVLDYANALTTSSKTPKVATEHYRNSIRLRWRYSGVPYVITIGKFTAPNVKKAGEIAERIEADITAGTFDISGERYKVAKRSKAPKPARLSAKQLIQQLLPDPSPVPIPLPLHPANYLPATQSPLPAATETVFLPSIQQARQLLALTHSAQPGIQPINLLDYETFLPKLFRAWVKTFQTVSAVIMRTQRMVDCWGEQIPIHETEERLNAMPYDHTTYNERLAVLKRLFKWAVRQGLIFYNPVADVESRHNKNKEKRKQRRPLLDEEIPLILDALRKDTYSKSVSAPHSTYYPFVKFMFMTGVRNAEAIGLQVKKVHFKEGYITVDQALATVAGKGTNVGARVLKCTKQGNSRNLPLTPELRKLLKPLCEGRHADAYVFTSNRGNAIDTHMFQKRIFKPLLKQLGIEDRDLYATRHTFGTVGMEQKDMSPTDLAYIMGHVNTETLVRVYTHLRKIPTKMPVIHTGGK